MMGCPDRATSKGTGISNVRHNGWGDGGMGDGGWGAEGQHPSSDEVSRAQSDLTWLRSLAGCNQCTILRVAVGGPRAVSDGLCSRGTGRVQS